MPYPHEHAARIRDPNDFQPDSYRRENDKFGDGIDAIFGKLKGEDTMTLQSIRFDASKYSPAEAKKWLEEHGYEPIEFEEASGEKKEQEQKQAQEQEKGKGKGKSLPKSGDRRACSFHFDAKVVAPTNDSDGKYGMIEGYASTFGNVDRANEVMDPGAFSKTIQESVPKRVVKLLCRHLIFGAAADDVIGTVIEAREDERGLWIRASLASTQIAQDIRTLVQEGHISGLSVGFEMVRWEIVQGENGSPDILHHKEVKLLEVTVTAFPMNPEASIISAKSFGTLATSIQKRIEEAPPAERVRRAEMIFGVDAGWDTLGEAFASLGAVLCGLAKDRAASTTEAPAKAASVAGFGWSSARESVAIRKRKALALSIGSA